MRAHLDWLFCAAALVAGARSQSPAFGQESYSIDVQALVTTAQGSSWAKFGGACRDKVGRFWAVAGHPSSPAAAKPGKVFLFSATGAYAGSFDQPGVATSAFAMRDLAYDPTTDLIYGGFESTLSGGVIWVLPAANAAPDGATTRARRARPTRRRRASPCTAASRSIRSRRRCGPATSRATR
jgi:hypothetical protein